MSTTKTPPSMGWKWDNTYSTLPHTLFSPVLPTPVAQPQLVAFNRPLANTLGLNSDAPEEEWAAILAGNSIPTGANPIAQAYAGHQFGHFTMLGDGRAILLGEHLTPQGERFDIQLKGPGQTPYSRRGDGRATLYAMLREYLISEAMHHLGIPTTRSLAVVTTGLPVYREQAFMGAVLTRIAASHIRVGTFEYMRHFVPENEWTPFVHYVIQRHYPDVLETEQPVEAFIQRVMLRQIDLIVNWMRVGFVHGVMNTDNMSIAGESIDYGPCAFINQYDPKMVFSSIDTQGRYAFGRQAAIAQWNLAILAGSLLPLLDPDHDKAVEKAKEIVNSYADIYQAKWHTMMRAKLGLRQPHTDDSTLIRGLLQWMERFGADYTNTFLVLGGDTTLNDGLYNNAEFTEWHQQWEQRVAAEPGGMDAARELMQQTNPAYIPRNHQVENALEAASESGDFSPLNTLLSVLSAPYEVRPEYRSYQSPPDDGGMGYRTFCGT